MGRFGCRVSLRQRGLRFPAKGAAADQGNGEEGIDATVRIKPESFLIFWNPLLFGGSLTDKCTNFPLDVLGNLGFGAGRPAFSPSSRTFQRGTAITHFADHDTGHAAELKFLVVVGVLRLAK